MVRLLTSLAPIGAIALAFAIPAAAAPRTVTVLADPNVITDRVATADLNLANADGQRALYRRVSAAAQSVCRPSRYTSLLTPEENLSCFIGAIDEARPQVAQAIQRATELAANGTSAIPAVSLAVSASF